MISDMVYVLEAPKIIITWIKFSVKGQSLKKKIQALLTSEVKGHFCKVVANPLKSMYKKYPKNIITGS